MVKIGQTISVRCKTISFTINQIKISRPYFKILWFRIFIAKSFSGACFAYFGVAKFMVWTEMSRNNFFAKFFKFLCQRRANAENKLISWIFMHKIINSGMQKLKKGKILRQESRFFFIWRSHLSADKNLRT